MFKASVLLLLATAGVDAVSKSLGCGSATSKTIGSTYSDSFKAGGVDRTFTVFVPEDYDYNTPKVGAKCDRDRGRGRGRCRGPCPCPGPLSAQLCVCYDPPVRLRARAPPPLISSLPSPLGGFLCLSPTHPRSRPHPTPSHPTPSHRPSDTTQPLIFSIHGWGGTSLEDSCDSGLTAVAKNTSGYIVAHLQGMQDYPKGNPSNWGAWHFNAR